MKLDKIVIDEDKGLVFSSEQELFDHFSEEIQFLEEEYFKLRSSTDIPDSELASYEKNLNEVLEDPDEIWHDTKTFEGHPFFIYIKRFEEEGEEGSDESDDEEDGFYHVAVTYLTDKIPSFVYLHFPTRDIDLVERYRRGELAFDRIHREAPPGAIEGDALLEGDELATGLYKAMLLLRSESDVKEEKFKDYADLREKAIEEADEIWRNNDTMGNVLVSFIKDFSDVEAELFYIVVTVEDTPSNSHALLFSFPTKDKNLIGRYRHGENLQADEVVQEASH